MIAYLKFMFLQLQKLTLTFLINATTFAMRHHDRLTPIPHSISWKTQLRSLWLRLKAFVYRVCDSQFFHVHHFLALNIIEFPFTSLTVADGQIFTCCLHTTKHRHKREVEHFARFKTSNTTFLVPQRKSRNLSLAVVLNEFQHCNINGNYQKKICFNCINFPIAALIRHQAGSTNLKRFRLNHEGKTTKTKAGSLNIPWCGDWFYFHQGLLTSVYARSSTYLFTQFQRSWPEEYTRINWKGVEGQESYIRKPKSPIIIIIYYYHFVEHCGAFFGLKWRIWRAKMYFSPLK